MTRHKSRVARRSRHRARRGTRKQTGGGVLSWLTGLFGSKPTDTNAAPPAAPAPHPAAAVAAAVTPNPQLGGRKTRHRRHRHSPHRK